MDHAATWKYIQRGGTYDHLSVSFSLIVIVHFCTSSSLCISFNHPTNAGNMYVYSLPTPSILVFTHTEKGLFLAHAKSIVWMYTLHASNTNLHHLTSLVMVIIVRFAICHIQSAIEKTHTTLSKISPRLITSEKLPVRSDSTQKYIIIYTHNSPPKEH